MIDIYTLWGESLLMGVGLGFLIGFIAWAIGFAFYGIIKLCKMA